MWCPHSRAAVPPAMLSLPKRHTPPEMVHCIKLMLYCACTYHMVIPVILWQSSQSGMHVPNWMQVMTCDICRMNPSPHQMCIIGASQGGNKGANNAATRNSVAISAAAAALYAWCTYMAPMVYIQPSPWMCTGTGGHTYDVTMISLRQLDALQLVKRLYLPTGASQYHCADGVVQV